MRGKQKFLYISYAVCPQTISDYISYVGEDYDYVVFHNKEDIFSDIVGKAVA